MSASVPQRDGNPEAGGPYGNGHGDGHGDPYGGEHGMGQDEARSHGYGSGDAPGVYDPGVYDPGAYDPGRPNGPAEHPGGRVPGVPPYPEQPRQHQEYLARQGGPVADAYLGHQVHPDHPVHPDHQVSPDAQEFQGYREFREHHESRAPQEPDPSFPPPGSGGQPGAAGRSSQPAPARRTGSPIIPPGVQPAALTAGLAAVTAATALFARPALAVAAVLLQAVTAAGWFRLNGMWPARQGIALAFLAGLTADAGLLLAPAGRAAGIMLGTLGVWIVLVLVQQLRHHGSADERLSSLMATAAATVLVVLATGYLAADGMSDNGSRAVVVAAVAVAVATVVRAMPLPSAVSVPVALLAAAGSGVATAGSTGPGTAAVSLALAAGVAALLGLRVASYDFPSRFVHFTAGVALPLTAAAPVVWLLAPALWK